MHSPSERIPEGAEGVDTTSGSRCNTTMTIDRRARLPFALLLVLAALCVTTAWAPPAGRTNWALEVGPGLALVAWMAVTYRRWRLSNAVYVGTFAHMLVLIYGGYYTYANTPLGNWAKTTWHLDRNHYDRVGHVALGFFPALFVREVLLCKTPLEPGGWLAFLTWSVVFMVGAVWELLEWWTTLLVASDVGQAFLGSQGDVWDAQWDMLLVGVGAALSLATLSGVHQRSLARARDGQ
jgi:putative membrane protein